MSAAKFTVGERVLVTPGRAAGKGVPALAPVRGAVTKVQFQAGLWRYEVQVDGQSKPQATYLESQLTAGR